MKIIGLTGGIATGKTTVTKMLKKRGYEVIDADAVVYELQAVGSPLLQKIRKAFGTNVLDEDGSLNRAELGKIVFSHADALAKLNKIMHPAVRVEFEKRIKHSKEDVLFLDVPLLFESNFDDLADINLVVSASRAVQSRRLMQRDGLTIEEAEARINSQMPMSQKEKLADFVIDNNDDLDALEEKVEKFLGEI